MLLFLTVKYPVMIAIGRCQRRQGGNKPKLFKVSVLIGFMGELLTVSNFWL